MICIMFPQYVHYFVNPLSAGKLTADQVKSGYSALKKIEECINRSDFGDRLVQACDQFYTRIPHSFG